MFDIIALILILISLIKLAQIQQQLSLPWMATPGGNVLPPGLAFERMKLVIQLKNMLLLEGHKWK
jgi:hypothetical protein